MWPLPAHGHRNVGKRGGGLSGVHAVDLSGRPFLVYEVELLPDTPDLLGDVLTGIATHRYVVSTFVVSALHVGFQPDSPYKPSLTYSLLISLSCWLLIVHSHQPRRSTTWSALSARCSGQRGP